MVRRTTRSPGPLGTPVAATAHRLVAKALAEQLVDGIEDLREIEVARLDVLQAALWPRVEKGEIRAVNAVLRIIDRRCRLLGLYTTRTAVEQPLWGLVVPEQEGNAGRATAVGDDDAGVDDVAGSAA